MFLKAYSQNNLVTTNLDIPGYTSEHTPTDSSAGDTLMFISNDFSYVLGDDLQIYSVKELESIFIKIIIPNKPSLILGAIYKRPSMKPYKFDNQFLEPLLSKIKAEGKAKFLAGDVNFNLIKYNQNKRSEEIPEHLFSNNFTPYIILPTRSILTSQTLIDNIFFNNQSYRSVSGNLTTSISDYLPQFVVLENFKKLCDIASKVKFTYRNFKDFDKKNV